MQARHPYHRRNGHGENGKFLPPKQHPFVGGCCPPFASQLHRTVDETSRTLHLPVIRFERKYPPRTENIIWCEDYADAIYRLEKAGTDRLLALTGVQTIGKLRPYWEKHTCWFRVLERETSITLAQEQGFPKGNLVFYHAGESEALY